MLDPGTYHVLVLVELALAVVTFVGLRFITAPYGRYERGGWGPTVPARVGWLVMEAPASLVFAAVYLAGAHRAALVPLLFFVLWQAHYAYRAFVYPFLLRGDKRMPITIPLMAVAFNLLNATVNAMAVSVVTDYRTSWLVDPRFLAGVALFVAGLVVNRGADRTLRGLRAPGESGYKVPTGGAYRWISCPNYFGEIVQWFGWALATWSLGGLAFAVYTTANLAPRALDHHRWYRETFPDYPPDRRALVPFVV